MIILSNPITLYAKSVITDLALRRGGPISTAPSPYSGMRYVVDKYWHDIEDFIPLEELFAKQGDFDPDVKQPQQNKEHYNASEAQLDERGSEYRPGINDVSFDNYYRRLEDIAEQYLIDFIGNIVYRIRNHEGGYHEYMWKNRFQRTLSNVGGEDDDDFTEVADLVIDEPERSWSIEERTRAMQRMPYVMKRLHNFSRICGVHMIGYLLAYQKARIVSNARNMSGSVAKFKNNDVIDQGVYLMKPNGYIRPTPVLPQNKNEKAAWAYMWVSGSAKEYQSYYKDCTDFFYYCDILNIDYMSEDTKGYGSEFVKNLRVTDITANSQYHLQVYEALVQNRKIMPKAVDDVETPLDITINLFNQACESSKPFTTTAEEHDKERSDANMKVAIELVQLYLDIVEHRFVKPEQFSWMNGFLHLDSQLVVLNSDYLNNSKDGVGFVIKDCILSELGYTLHVDRGSVLTYLTTNTTLENYIIRVFNKKDCKRVEWRSMYV